MGTTDNLPGSLDNLLFFEGSMSQLVEFVKHPLSLQKVAADGSVVDHRGLVLHVMLDTAPTHKEKGLAMAALTMLTATMFRHSFKWDGPMR